tara:strand:- start:205 stop:1653 length:1449 start_codon:yes stop_codon:yes gene_type:complete
MRSNIKKLNLQNSYLQLPACFYEKIKPSLVENPKLIYFNKKLAKDLNLDFLNDDKSLIINYFSGNKLPYNSQPIAQAYAGHQFGRFTMLGDGRAILLGEKEDSRNNLYDIQLKGAGKTSFSRLGDGRATLSSMLREYLMSESMYNLKISTTRSLAVIDSGEKIFRETINNGAILTRIASSHIRVGTFEYAKYFCSKDDYKKFTNYVIKRHYPIIINHESPYLELLSLVMKKQIDLVIDWHRVGFIHGVMNTDNMTISGETIDYGPCAFLNTYNPKTVYSSIDHHGRYAFENQHKIAYWNLSVFAGTLLQFIDSDENKAIDLAQNVLDQFPIIYTKKWYKMMFDKLGINNPKEEDKVLIDDLLELMELKKADYTNTFAALTMSTYPKNSLFKSHEFKSWENKWKNRVKYDENSYNIMKDSNPIYIPRNHLVESALESAVRGNKEEFNKLLEVMSNTYNYDVKHEKLQSVPKDFDKYYKTYCGT